MHSEHSVIRNKVQLITYADSLGKNLKELDHALETYFKDIVYGVHILPFFPSSSDRGFSPLTHFEVDPKFGTWEDIENISRRHDMMCDFIINHVSKESHWFQDYLDKGEESQYSDYFITEEKFGEMTDDVLQKVDLPRPVNPFLEFTFKDGTKKNIWCTFSTDQIDVDTNNPEVRQYFKDILDFLTQKGVKIIRLDAAGYAVKERNTSCFLIPQTYDLIEEMTDVAHENGIVVLPEMHNHYTLQLTLSHTKGVDYVYDFALPIMVMHAIFTQNAKNLKHWINIRPKKVMTTLDTHDGLPIPDVVDLISEEDRDMIASKIKENGGDAVERASGANSENVDHYQINCTYYSALGKNDDAYMVARAIQFFVPGIPQVYYVGLLVGENDEETLDKTQNGRDINRHAYTLEEIGEEIERPVVKRLFHLIRFRNQYEAFNGTFYVKHADDEHVILGWHKDEEKCELFVNFKTLQAYIEYVDAKTKTIETITV